MREASNILSCSFIAFIPTRESFICYSYEPSSITFTFFRIFFSFSVLFFFFSFLFIFFFIFVFVFSIIYTRSLPEIYVEIGSKFVISMGLLAWLFLSSPSGKKILYIFSFRSLVKRLLVKYLQHCEQLIKQFLINICMEFCLQWT